VKFAPHLKELMSPQPDPLRWKALALLCLAFFMVILDAQIVILGLPSIEADLGLSASGAQWVLSAYLLSFGGLLLLGGRSADLLGRRRMFMVGTALFLIASLVCGLAWAGGVLIAARVAQGMSAAIMAPTALSILMTLSGGSGAQQGARYLVGDRRCWGHVRAPHRRTAHRWARVGVDLLHQYPGGARAARA
jgi:MFS family permease